MSDPNDKDWPVTWEANRLEQLRAALEATPEQRLEWLENAMRLALEAGGLKPGESPRSEGDEPSSE